MAQLFGTDGIRGIANQYPMTAEVALHVGRAVARYFKGRSRRVDKQSIVLIGKDTRRSSYMIEQALAAGVTSEGAFALLVGPMPTPGVAFLTESMRADAGIMVSASHNPFEYNGIKLFGHDGFKLPDPVEAMIEEMVLSKQIKEELPTGECLGRAKRIDDAIGRYIVHAKSVFPKEMSLDGMRIVLDCANGAAYSVAPTIFAELGAEILPIGVNPNGTNINEKVGAVHPESMAKAVQKYRADIGIALDGDADRVILADDQGNIVDGDTLMALLATFLKDKEKLNKNTIVATPMSNMGLEVAMKKEKLQVVYSDIGDRSVVDVMRRNEYNLGGEQSGHIIYMDVSKTGDGIVAALSILAVLLERQKPLSELRKIVSVFPQVLKNVMVSSKTPLEELTEVQAVVKDVTEKLKGRGRVLVRYSGTEPICRVMIEGENDGQINRFAGEIADKIEDAIGVSK